MTEHRDLSDEFRPVVEMQGKMLVWSMAQYGQSLALAREAWINAFDREAERLDAQ